MILVGKVVPQSLVAKFINSATPSEQPKPFDHLEKANQVQGQMRLAQAKDEAQDGMLDAGDATKRKAQEQPNNQAQSQPIDWAADMYVAREGNGTVDRSHKSIGQADGQCR